MFLPILDQTLSEKEITSVRGTRPEKNEFHTKVLVFVTVVDRRTIFTFKNPW